MDMQTVRIGRQQTVEKLGELCRTTALRGPAWADGENLGQPGNWEAWLGLGSRPGTASAFPMAQ